MRLATPSSLPAIIALTESAYASYLPVLGYPPVPMTEDYAPRIERGEVWLLDHKHQISGLIVLERHPTHAEIFSVAVDPEHRGQGLGAACSISPWQRHESGTSPPFASTPMPKWSGT